MAAVPSQNARPAVFKPGRSAGRRIPLGRQLMLQALCLFILFTVLFPILWVVSMSLDGRNQARPKNLNFDPTNMSLNGYRKVIEQPTGNKVSFAKLALNSTLLAGGVSFGAVLVGVSAAYAFSRLRFSGRGFFMLAILFVLLLPNTAGIAPLFVLLNSVNIGEFNLRNSLYGVGMAMVSGALPFAIWNLKGYLDTIPKELEEAATIDGASSLQTFFRIILPLATPALAVTAFLGFMAGWTEFAVSWAFLTDPQDFTLAMALYNMTGQYSGSIPWSRFAAMALMVAAPVSIVYLLLQKYIVSGLTVGGVKG